MLPPRDVICHRTFGSDTPKKCFDLVVDCKCRLWQHVLGTDPQTGKEVDHFDCLDAMQSKLLIENSKFAYETSREVNQLRNEIAALATARQLSLNFSEERARIGRDQTVKLPIDYHLPKAMRTDG